MSMNPGRPPEPRKVQLAKATQRLLHGQSFAVGIIVGFLLGLLARVVGG